MKGKGYRSSFAKAVWIVIAHLAAVAAVICAAMFLMIYQTGIRLDDRGKSYTESETFEKQISDRGSDILVSLAAQDDINYLKNAGSSAVIDLADFEEKGKKKSFNIKKNQIQGLQKWSSYLMNCGLVINFRNKQNRTFYIPINEFIKYTSTLDKKSINMDDVLQMNPIEIENKLLRTNYKYDLDKFLQEIYL